MPNINQLPAITTASDRTYFVVTDDRLASRFSFKEFSNQLAAINFKGSSGPPGPMGIAGPAGPLGPPGPTGAGYTGSASTAAGYAGSRGYTGSVGAGYTGSASTAAGYAGSTGYVGSTGAGYTGSAGSAGVGVGGSLLSRAVFSTTTVALSVGATATANVDGYKTYVLSKIQTTAAAWVRLYSDATSRTNDSTRSSGNDPLSGSGVIAEVITTSGNLTQLITPGVVGFNNDTVTTSTVYMSVTNNSSSSQAIGVSVTLLKLES